MDNPKYDLDDEVIQKFFGVGKIDQRRITTTGNEYHIVFNCGPAAWMPEKDLMPAKHRKEKQK